MTNTDSKRAEYLSRWYIVRASLKERKKRKKTERNNKKIVGKKIIENSSIRSTLSSLRARSRSNEFFERRKSITWHRMISISRKRISRIKYTFFVISTSSCLCPCTCNINGRAITSITLKPYNDATKILQHE